MADIRQNTKILDDFNRADEDPLSGGGNWARTDSVWVDDNRLHNNLVTESTTSNFSASYWTPTSFDGDDAEAWATGVGGNIPGIFWGMALVSSPGGSSAIDGYEFQNRVTTGGSETFLYKITNGSYSAVDGPNAPMPTAGPWIMLIRRNGSDVEGWYSVDDGDTWTMRVNVTDTSYTTDLYASLSLSDNARSWVHGWDNFGVGPAEEFLPQFIRRPWRYQGKALTLP